VLEEDLKVGSAFITRQNVATVSVRLLAKYVTSVTNIITD